MAYIWFWFCADNINILGGNLQYVNKCIYYLVFGSKETGLEICANENSNIVTYQDQDAEWRDNTEIENRSFGIV
jgi:hypothetical protein